MWDKHYQYGGKEKRQIVFIKKENNIISSRLYDSMYRYIEEKKKDNNDECRYESHMSRLVSMQ